MLTIAVTLFDSVLHEINRPTIRVTFFRKATDLTSNWSISSTELHFCIFPETFVLMLRIVPFLSQLLESNRAKNVQDMSLYIYWNFLRRQTKKVYGKFTIPLNFCIICILFAPVVRTKRFRSHWWRFWISVQATFFTSHAGNFTKNYICFWKNFESLDPQCKFFVKNHNKNYKSTGSRCESRHKVFLLTIHTKILRFYYGNFIKNLPNLEKKLGPLLQKLLVICIYRKHWIEKYWFRIPI